MYRIAWFDSKRNGNGNGEYCLELQTAASWIKKLNKEYPEIKHWVEYDSNNIPCRVPDYLVSVADSSSLREEQVQRLLLAHLTDT